MILVKKNRCSDVFQNGPFLLAGSVREVFFDIYHGNLVKVLEIHLKNIRVPYDCPPLEFLTLRLIHNESTGIGQLEFKFSYPSTGCRRVAASESLLW